MNYQVLAKTTPLRMRYATRNYSANCHIRTADIRLFWPVCLACSASRDSAPYVPDRASCRCALWTHAGDFDNLATTRLSLWTLPHHVWTCTTRRCRRLGYYS